MKILYPVIAFLVFLMGQYPASAAGLPENVNERIVRVGDLKRHFLEFRPVGLGQGRPLVMVLHGGGQSMRKMLSDRRLETRRWLELADQNRFMVIAPNGTNGRSGDTGGNRQSWNDLRSPEATGRTTVNDVRFLSMLVELAVREYRIDRSRVYVTGASNGGMMTYRMLVERPELFAAGVAFIANLPARRLPTPALPTPIMIVNGTEDRLVPYEGGTVGRNRGVVRSTRATVEYWLSHNSAFAEDGQRQVLPNLNDADGCYLVRTEFPAPSSGAPVVLVRMEGGGHTLPSRIARPFGPVRKRILGTICRDVEAADFAWEFMRQHRR